MFKPNILACLVAFGLLPLSGCDQTAATAAVPVASPSAPVQTPPQVYTPLNADQLYQLVSPIALFPDKLLAQVLAGAGYPDQISAADRWLRQNHGLSPANLSNAANSQPWDSSIRSLVLFPDVIDQMAKNIAWTTQLGSAYLNDPTDVMNAIQVMRQRASQKGTLKNTQQQRVVVSSMPPDYVDPQTVVVMAPPQTIVIEPSQPDVLYVPYYDPWIAYGEAVPVYPGYHYAAPAGYSGGEMLATGILSFGAGIALEALINDRHHGWNDWDMHWGGHYDGRHQPVVYNNEPYISHSTTVVEHFDQVNDYHNVNQYNTVNHYDSHNRYNSPTMVNPQTSPMPHFAAPAVAHPSGQVSAPSAAHFAPTAAAMPHAQPPVTTPNFHMTQYAHPPIAGERHNTQALPAAIHPSGQVNHPVRPPAASESQPVFHAQPAEHPPVAAPVHQKMAVPVFHQAPAPMPIHHANTEKRPPEHFLIKRVEHKEG